MWLFVKISITAILVGVIIWQVGGTGEVLEVMGRMHRSYIVLALLVSTGDRGLMTFKWAQLLRGRGIRLPFLFGMKIYCASMIWGLFLPSTMGADAIRAFSASRAGLKTNEVVASIIVERIVGFLSALLLGLGSCILLSSLGILDPRLRLVWWLVGSALAGATIVFAMSFNENVFDFVHDRAFYRFRGARIMKRLRQFHSTYRDYQNDKGNLAAFFALTFGEQFFAILYAWVIARGLGIDVSLLAMTGAIPLSLLISRIPISIDGLGVFDGMFIILLSLAGVSAAEAVAIAFVGRVLQIFSWLPWWLIHVIQNSSVRPPQPAVEGQ